LLTYVHYRVTRNSFRPLVSLFVWVGYLKQSYLKTIHYLWLSECFVSNLYLKSSCWRRHAILFHAISHWPLASLSLFLSADCSKHSYLQTIHYCSARKQLYTTRVCYHRRIVNRLFFKRTVEL